MKKTVLFERHEKLNEKIVDFAGFLMPVSYSSVNEEHLHVRNSVGVFDVSHMGEIEISGSKSLDLVQHICSNDISKLKIGKAQYNCLTNEKGGIIDDLIVYRIETEKYLLIVNASNIVDNNFNICFLYTSSLVYLNAGGRPFNGGAYILLFNLL